MYTVPPAPIPTLGSESAGVLDGFLRTVHVSPLSSDTATAWLPPQPLLGTYTVPSGATFTCPCRPPQSSSEYIGTAGPYVRPPSRLTAQEASAMSWEQ